MSLYRFICIIDDVGYVCTIMRDQTLRSNSRKPCINITITRDKADVGTVQIYKPLEKPHLQVFEPSDEWLEQRFKEHEWGELLLTNDDPSIFLEVPILDY